MSSTPTAGTSTPIVYRVHTRSGHLPVSNAESCIVSVPPGLYVHVAGGPPAVNVAALGKLIREVSEACTASVRSVLHHADWVITSDPAVVEERGMHGNPGCVTCRAGVDQALAHLADQRRELLVGVLYWAGGPT